MKHFAVTTSILIITAAGVALQAQELSVEICKWKGDAHAAFSLIHDDFGDGNFTPEILRAGTMAYERGVKIASAAVVQRMVNAGDERWNEMNSFIAQGHEIVNHSWNHDSPTSAGWDDFRDMMETRDSIEAHLADSVWQKQVSFFCFPEDAGTAAQLDSLEAYGYIGARWRSGYGGERINAGGTEFNPFQSDFYGYISQEYGDSVLAVAPNSTYTDWWLTYPDKPYFTYKSPIEMLEQRHLDKTVESGGWGLMGMHSIAPAQIYPTESPWWCPMSYEKYERLLDRIQELQESDSLWMDVPSRIAAYTVLRNGTEVTVKDSTISFEYGSVDARYETELTLKIATHGRPVSFTRNGKAVESYPVDTRDILPDTVYLDVNPVDGPITFRAESVSVERSFAGEKSSIHVSVSKNDLHLILPQGNYSVRIFNFRGRTATQEIVGLSDGVSPIVQPHSLAAGSYVLVTSSNGIQSTRKITVH